MSDLVIQECKIEGCGKPVYYDEDVCLEHFCQIQGGQLPDGWVEDFSDIEPIRGE